MNDTTDKRDYELISRLTSEIDTINRFIEWSDAHLTHSRRDETFKELVNARRKLKRLRRSLESAPAIAAFGESQKGKSYVISSLLACRGRQFMVKDPKTGQSYNFVEQFNPHTNETEATGVATRFTCHCPAPDDAFPVTVRLLSLSDILQILCDSAYNDVGDHTVISSEDLDEFAARQERRYAGVETANDVIDEDDVLNIREYIELHIGQAKAGELLGSRYFDVLARVAGRSRREQWPELMSKLWYDNPHFTRLFARLIEGFASTGFASRVYVPISALLNSTTTLMSSMCLSRLSDGAPVLAGSDPNDGTDIRTEDGTIVAGFSKSILSALTAEVVFQIPEDTIAEELTYSLEGIADEAARARLVSKGWNKRVSKDFLRSVDILDFPGARSALDLRESQIEKELPEKMVLRGKVRYLFNKYNDERMISVLMLCHDYMQTGPSAMPTLVKQWVDANVGTTRAERTALLRRSIASPLLLIATKFNFDMSHSVSDTGDQQISQRWRDRYKKVLYDQVLQAGSIDWFNKWTDDGGFRSTFLLRDFKYSGPKGSQLFEGFVESGRETRETDPAFHRKLRDSFIASPEAGLFFDDPQIAWDAAATMNNDGATRIIESLALVAGTARDSRHYKYTGETDRLHRRVESLMSSYYHDESGESILEEAIGRSGAVAAELDVACGKDNYFFGRMMQGLQPNASKVFDLFYKLLESTDTVAERDMKEYDTIMARCHGRLSPRNTVDENLDILRRAYRFPTAEKCRAWFEGKGISLTTLFGADFHARSNSEQLSETLVERWLETIRSASNLRLYEAAGCDTLTILDMLDSIAALSRHLHLAADIAKRISPFVDAINVPRRALDMLADTTTQMVSHFVDCLGFDRYSADALDKIRAINDKQQLGLSLDYGRREKAPSGGEELSRMFDDMRPTDAASHEGLPSFTAYNEWIEKLTVAFIASCEVPSYDVEANHRLGEMLRSF